MHHQLPAPLAKVLNDKWGIKRGLMTTVHAATATQKTVDGPSNKDRRGGAASSRTSSPAATGAAKAVGVVIPELNKKLTGMSFRVPTSDVGGRPDRGTEQPATYLAICAPNEGPVRRRMKGVLIYTEEQGGRDGLPRQIPTSVFRRDAGIALDKTRQVVSWYDNEWGYCRCWRWRASSPVLNRPRGGPLGRPVTIA